MKSCNWPLRQRREVEMQKSLSSPGICENKSTEESRDKSSASGSHACLIPQCAEIILRYSSRGIQMNPSALFTYARASISRSTSAREKTREEETSVPRAQDISSASSSYFVPLCTLCSIRYISSLSLPPFSSRIYTSFPSLASS